MEYLFSRHQVVVVIMRNCIVREVFVSLYDLVKLA